MPKRKKGSETLQHFFPVAQYLAAVLIALCYPRLNETTWLLPGVEWPRIWLMLWVIALLGLSYLMDRAYLKAYYRDLVEIQNKVPNGNLNRSTLLALGVPLMFVVDAVAIAHLYLSYFRSNTAPVSDIALNQHTVAMAVGMVLWIYGRLLPKIPYKSIWGIRTKATMADQLVWGKAHLKAVPWLCGSGAAALMAASVFSGTLSFILSALFCVVAFIGMFAAAK